MRKPRTFLEDAHAALSTALSVPLSPLTSFLSVVGGGGGSGTGTGAGAGSGSSGATTGTGVAAVTAEEVRRSGVDLHEDEVLEEDRAEAEDVDDSPDEQREVRVVTVGERDATLTMAAIERRRWEILPIRRRAVYSSRQASMPTSA